MGSAADQSHRLRQRKAQLLPWLADPLTHILHNEHEHGHHGEGHSDKKGNDSGSSSEDSLVIQEEIEAEEATPGELFYDLFFVANLTTITSVHAMTDYTAVVSYIQFFIIMWFTWLQTSLYDIRFSVDSFYERIVKFIHFGVMIGFASTSTAWNPMDSKGEQTASTLQIMSLTLMISRFALGVQYGVCTLFAAKHKKPIMPFLIHSASMLLAGFVYLGLYLQFNGDTVKRANAYVGWYVVIVFEIIAVVASSSIWKVAGFKYTHLVERLGLLTLIILGEGIIVMLKAVNAVQKGNTFGRGWNGSIFGVIVAAVLVIYFLYMLYFDYTPARTHYGSIRQQIWAILHFPFHLAIVLAVEGLRQFTTWWSFYQAIDYINQLMASVVAGVTDPDQIATVTLTVMKEFIGYLYKEGSAKSITKNYTKLSKDLGVLMDTPASNWTTAQIRAYNFVTLDLNRGYAEFYGIKVPKTKKEDIIPDTIDDPNWSPLEAVVNVYDLVFRYFFLAMGVIFIMYGVLGLFVRRRKDVWDYFSIALRWAAAICFFGILGIRTNEEKYVSYGFTSPMPIPTTCIILFLVLAIDKIVGVFAYKRMKASKSE